MFRIFPRQLRGHQKGITGLETAIILISFVVVASVFSYVVLSAGIYSSQKSKEAVYNGIKTAQGAIIIKGSVIAMAENVGADGYISQLTFTLANAVGGDPVDFTPPLATGTDGKAPEGSQNEVVISYFDQYQKVDDLFWTLTKVGNNNGNNVLDANEQFQITIGSAVHGVDGGNLVDALVHHLGPNTDFTIEIMTPLGSTITIERTTPAIINAAMNLDY